MKRSEKHTGGIWAYLEASGVLEKGTEEEIKSAKKAYRKIYLKKYKQIQREENPEFTVLLSRQKGEYGKISVAAKKHHMSIPAFLRLATFAYLSNSYLVPDMELIAKLYQKLNDCLNEIKSIAHTKERYGWDREQKIEAIERQIEKLETDMGVLFHNPPLLEDAIRKAVGKNPLLRERLLNILTDDRQE